MTVREFFEKELVARGMFESQAKTVMDAVVADDINCLVSSTFQSPLRRDNAKLQELVFGRWNDQFDSFPVIMMHILWGTRVRPQALEWIKKNVPKAWYRPVFDDDMMTKLRQEGKLPPDD